MSSNDSDYKIEPRYHETVMSNINENTELTTINHYDDPKQLSANKNHTINSIDQDNLVSYRLK